MSDKKRFPFVYHEGIYVKFLNKYKHGAIKNIRMLFERQFLDDVDTAILLHLQKYVYINAFLLYVLLDRQMVECNLSFCKNRLSKLEKLGFVVRFQFIYPDDRGVEHATPFVYCLSSNARKLFPVSFDQSFENNIMEIDCVQRRLSFNQFHIMLEGQYEKALKFSSYQFGREFDGLYKLTFNNQPLVFYAFSIRSNEGWEKQYLNRVRQLKEYIIGANLSFSAILVICEYEYQALRAERVRSGDKGLCNLDIYYVCDYAAVAEGALLHHIIAVNPEKNFSSYNIIKIHVDGQVKENVTNKAVNDKE